MRTMPLFSFSPSSAAASRTMAPARTTARGGMAFVMGGSVKGGFYGECPSLEPEDQVEGDMRFNNDFRGIYATLLDRWMGVDPQPVLDGTFEQFDMIKR